MHLVYSLDFFLYNVRMLRQVYSYLNTSHTVMYMAVSISVFLREKEL